MEQHGAKKWLTDDRTNSAPTKEETEWCKTVWEPSALKAGWKYWAIVLPKRMVGQMYMKNLKQTKEIGVTIEFFDNPDDALAWLEKQ
jgi:hypothetical protein